MADISDSTWNETDALNNAVPPLGWPEGQMPSTVNDCARADKGALKRFWDRANPVITTTGAATAFIYTTANTAYPAQYVPGELLRWKAHQASVGNDVFQLNGLAVLPLYKRGMGGPVLLAAGDINAGDVLTTYYDPTLNAGAGGMHVEGSGIGYNGPITTVGPITIAPVGAGAFAEIVLNRPDASGYDLVQAEQAGTPLWQLQLANPNNDCTFFRFVGPDPGYVLTLENATGFAHFNGLPGLGAGNGVSIGPDNGGSASMIAGAQSPSNPSGDYLLIAANRVGSSRDGPLIILRGLTSPSDTNCIELYAGSQGTGYQTALFQPSGNFQVPTLTVTGNASAANLNLSQSLNVAVNLAVGGLLQVEGGGNSIYAPNGNIVAGGQLFGSSLSTNGTLSVSGTATINGDVALNGGSNALSVPNGNIICGGIIESTSGSAQAIYSAGGIQAAGQIYSGNSLSTAGSLVVTTTASVGGDLTVSGGGTAISAPNGNVSVGGVLGVGGAATISGDLTVYGGGTAINAPDGNASIGGYTYTQRLCSLSGGAGCLNLPDNSIVNFQQANGTILYYQINSGAAHVVASTINAWDFLIEENGGDPNSYYLCAWDGGPGQQGNEYQFFGQPASDARIKAKIADSAIDALALLRQIPLRRFEYLPGVLPNPKKSGERNPARVPVDLGWIAQEVQAAIPRAVYASPHERAPDDPIPTGVLSVAPEVLVPYLLRALQQLADRLDAMEAA